MFGFGKNKNKKEKLEEIIIEEELSQDNSFEDDAEEVVLEKEVKVNAPLKTLTKEEILNQMKSMVDLNVKPASGHIKRKNKYDLQLESLRKEIEELIVLQETKKGFKTSNLGQNILLGLMVLALGSAGYLGYEKVEEYNNNFKDINKQLKNMQNVIAEKNEENINIKDLKIEDKIVKELKERITLVEKNNTELSTKINTLDTLTSQVNKIDEKVTKVEENLVEYDERFKALSQVLDLVNINMQSISELKNQIGDTKSIESKDEINKTEYDKMLLEFKNINDLMTDLVSKQKNEILSLNEKIAKIEKDLNGKPVGEVTNMLTKEDQNKITMLETRLLKNNDIINNLNKSFNNFLEEYNASKVQELESSRIESKKVENQDKEIVVDNPPFMIYKIINNKTFYIKNRLNGKLLEQDINLGDVIIDRYEVINIDKENQLVIFKDYETKKSIVLKENK